MFDKRILIFGVFALLTFIYVFKLSTEHLNNGRYVPMVIAHEKSMGSYPSVRDDKFYVLDTRTGKLCKPEYQGYKL